MIFKRKETKTIFHPSEKQFKQYFDKNKNHYEKNQEQLLMNLLENFFSKAYNDEKKSIHDFLSKDYPYIGYTDHYGYYALASSDGGYFTLVEGFPCQNFKEAFYLIVQDYLWSYGVDFESNHREQLEKDYNKRFHNSSYNDVLYFCEYALDKWDKFYDDNIPDNIVKYYEEHLNHLWISSKQNIKWEYDQNKHLFSFIENENNNELNFAK